MEQNVTVSITWCAHICGTAHHESREERVLAPLRRSRMIAASILSHNQLMKVSLFTWDGKILNPQAQGALL